MTDKRQWFYTPNPQDRLTKEQEQENEALIERLIQEKEQDNGTSH